MKKTASSHSAFFTPRTLIGLLFCLTGAFIAVAGFAQTPKAQWPSMTRQLSQEYHGRRVRKGSALEALIRRNQDFSILHEQEKADKLNLPPWIRVWYRKAHTDVVYSVDDPSGGYPRVLNEILEWMVTHQDLKRGLGVSAGSTEEADETDALDATIGSDVRISGAQTARRSESDIRVNYVDAQKIISASNNIGGSGLQAIYYSTDGGANWSQTTLPIASGDSFHSDPTCDWTSDGTAWSSTLGINSSGSILKVRNYFSTNNGATWTLDATASGSQTNTDKQMVWVDHSPSSPFRDQMYAIWHNGNPAYMNRRTANPGGTWLASPIQVSGSESSGTCIGADVKTNSAGDVFGGWPTTSNRKLLVVKSTNGGASFGTPVQITTTFDSFDIGIPSMNSRRALIYITLGAYKTATKNNVYATWTDLTGATGCTSSSSEPGSNTASTCKTRIWFSRSTDGGATWSAKTMINNQASLNDQFNQWMAVDETTGGIAITYYDTVSDSGRKKTDLWYQSSMNDGASWSAAQKITAGQTDETVSGADNGNQYGDYNSLSGNLSTFFPSWTDRRNNSREEIWTAKIVDSFTVSPHVATSGSTLAAGSCGSPAEAAVDPTETVTVNLCVQNDGNGPTGDVIGTLQATGGVTNPSAPQDYGVMNSGSGAVCRSFTFTATGMCGGNVTASLKLQSGPTDLGTIPFTFPLGTPNILTSESFDGVTAPALPANWTASNASGTGLWVTSATTPESSPNDAFVDDPASVSDKRLDSASFTVPTATSRLIFRNNYNLQSSGGIFFDGGVLEVSSPNINGGAFTDVTDLAVGGSFVSGGYVGAISNANGNPLAGRQAWSGNSNGYITTTVNLGPNVVGQTIQVRFRMGSDSSTSGAGWRIDSVTLQDGSHCSCVPVAQTVVSRKTQGAGSFDVDLGGTLTEPRSGGPTGDHQIVVTFPGTVSVGSASVTTGVGSVSNVAVNGAEVTVSLTGVADAQTLTVTLTNVMDSSGNSGDIAIPVSFLLGDVTGDGAVNSADIGLAKSKSGQDVDGSNFRVDVNDDGTINSGDISLVKSRSGNALP